MDQSFYIGAVGAQQQQQRMQVQGNNIANVNTYGFKADRGRFGALMYEDMRGIDGARLPAGVGACLLNTAADFAQGGSAATGRAQDYRIDGRGFFALADLSTGEVSFTRNGAFAVAEYERPGEETDEAGQPVMETVLCLSDGSGRFVLGRDGGLIEVKDPAAGQDVGVFDYGNYDGMERLADTRFLPIEKNGNLWRGQGKLVRGSLELSNVDLAEELAKVIEAQRAYGMALKVVQTSDEIETTINGLRG